MGVDKFGRHTGANSSGPAGRAGIGFNLDNFGNFDITDKRLINLSNPIDDNDACTKIYVDNIKKEVINFVFEFLKTIENVKTIADQ